MKLFMKGANHPIRKRLAITAMKTCRQYFQIEDEPWSVYFEVVPQIGGAPEAGGAARIFNLEKKQIQLQIVEAYFLHGSLALFLEVVCHEMVHVKQYVTGQYRQEEKSVIFNGKTYSANAVNFAMEFRLQDILPWEAEAYPVGKKLASMVLNSETN